MNDSLTPMEAAPLSADPPGNSPGTARRVAVTLLVPALVVLAARVPLPGYMLDQMKSVPGFKPELFGALSLGLNPVLWAFWVVELAALVVPRWRQLRTGGFAGRDRLQKATGLVAFVFAGIQSFSVALYSQGAHLLPPGSEYRLYVVVALMAGTFFVWWLAGIVGRHGAANGFSVLIAGTGIASLIEQTVPAIRAQLIADEPITPLLMVAVVVGLGFALLRRGTSHSDGHPQPRLREPSSGLVPLTVAAALVALPATLMKAGVLSLSSLHDDLLDGMTRFVALAVLVTALTPLFTWIFNRPTKVARVWARLRPAAEGSNAKPAMLRPMVRTGRFLGGVVMLASVTEMSGIPLDVVTLLVVVAVVMDLVEEILARHKLGEVVVAWPVHRIYAADAAVAALREAKIAVFARGLRHRSLWHFFAPFVPVELLVPAKELDKATNILRPLLLGEQVTPPPAS